MCSCLGGRRVSVFMSGREEGECVHVWEGGGCVCWPGGLVWLTLWSMMDVGCHELNVRLFRLCRNVQLDRSELSPGQV